MSGPGGSKQGQNPASEGSDFPLGVTVHVHGLLRSIQSRDGCAHGWEVTPTDPCWGSHEALEGTLVSLLAFLGWDLCLLDAGSKGQDMAVLGPVLAPPKSALDQ